MNRPERTLAPGTVVAGEFEIERPLDQGGFGAVYIALQKSTGKRRALKVLFARLEPGSKAHQRFELEARAGSSIDSEHVVEVIAAGVDEQLEAPWIAMELLQGEDLQSRVKQRGALAWGEALALLRQLAHGLAAAHRAGLVHRDVKPKNIFVATARREGAPVMVKLLDFGVAKVVRENPLESGATEALGSPLWMAPEQASVPPVIRPETDVWAFGLVTFYLLTGERYWKSARAPSADPAVLLKEILFDPIEPASARALSMGLESKLPPGFDAWFARCVHRDLDARFANAADALDALTPLLSGPTSAAVSTETPSSEAPTRDGRIPIAPKPTQENTLPQPTERTVTGAARDDGTLASRSRARPAFAALAATAVLGLAIAWSARVAMQRRYTSLATPHASTTAHTSAAPEVDAGVNRDAPSSTPSGGAALASAAPSATGAATTLPRVEDLSLGAAHSCARDASGAVYCWGRNLEGALGDGTHENRARPTRVHGLAPVTQVACGTHFTCARTSDGAVYCWGVNVEGQLGDGTNENRARPTRVHGLGLVASIAAGESHACARETSGAVRCWGSNDAGMLGDGTTRDSATPVLASLRRRAIALAAGLRSSCAVTDDQRVWCWGSNATGQLALAAAADKPRPTELRALRGVVQVELGGLGARGAHGCAVSATGALRCWGWNSASQLATEAPASRFSPEEIQGIPPVRDLDLGGRHSCIAGQDGAVYCWGDNRGGQLALARTTANLVQPRRVPGLRDVVEVVAGGAHSCARDDDGLVWCWGSNSTGQVGDDSTRDRESPTPVRW